MYYCQWHASDGVTEEKSRFKVSQCSVIIRVNRSELSDEDVGSECVYLKLDAWAKA